jgi:hypothetical protein
LRRNIPRRRAIVNARLGTHRFQYAGSVMRQLVFYVMIA